MSLCKAACHAKDVYLQSSVIDPVAGYLPCFKHVYLQSSVDGHVEGSLIAVETGSLFVDLNSGMFEEQLEDFLRGKARQI